MSLNIHNVCLEAMAVSSAGYPSLSLPEIALVGRSNVGKSSLINALFRRKKLAYTSASPGKTQTVNFYLFDDALRIVDLPGYGFAKASKQAQQAWARSIDEYLNGRETLREVVLLCDLRHEPSNADVEMYQWIRQAGFTGYVVGTKSDKLPRTKLPVHLSAIRKKLGVPDFRYLLPYSAVDRKGLDEVFRCFLHICGFTKEEIRGLD